MKKLLLVISSVALLNNISAQDTIQNPSFERWVPDMFGINQDPEGWGTLNILSLFGATAPVTKVSPGQQGQFAARMETVTFNDPQTGETDTISGLLLTGDILANEMGFPYNQRPVTFRFHYKYTQTAVDTGLGLVNFTKWDAVNQEQIFLGQAAVLITANASNFTLATSPVTWDPAYTDAPDTAMIAFASSGGEVPIPGSFLIVDNVELVMPGTGINGIDNENHAVKVYPNPVVNTVSFEMDFIATNIDVIDTKGRLVKVISVNGNSVNSDVSDLAAGTYFYNIRNNGIVLSRGKIQIVK
jgi:hypothetical protein